MAQIATEDYVNKLIYLHIDTVTSGFSPALMQQEHRMLRRLNAGGERNFDPMVSFVGNEDVGGGKKTAWSTRLRAGVRIVPYDTDHSLPILNEILNVPDGVANVGVFDRSSVASNVDIDIGFNPVEVIEVTTGGGIGTPAEVADAVWDAANADHLTAGSTGKALDDAGAAGNPWSSTIAGNQTPGTFGALVSKKLQTFIKSFIK